MSYNHLTEKKHQLDAYRPLPPELVTNLDEWFRIELTYTSNAIEGNTLTRQETALVVEKGLTVGGKSLAEHLEATNHAGALDWVKSQTKRKAQQLSQKDILHIHELILKGIDDNNAGHYRNVAVRISGSTVILPNPMKVPTLMERFIKFLNTSKDLHPVELAAEAHYQLVSIHPFVDGNGRTARLLMNLILMMHGYPPAIIRKRDRLAYINALEKAQLGGPKADYLRLITQSVERSFNIYFKAINQSDEQGVAEFEEEKLLKIGQLAQETGESNSTIRHWTKLGLLSVTDMSTGGYQLYSRQMIERVQKIQQLKQKRLTLEEIKKQLDSD